MISLWGFEIKRKSDEDKKDVASFAQETTDDGAINIPYSGIFGTTVDFDTAARSESDLIIQYREMTAYPTLDRAVDDIVNEAIVMEENKPPVAIVLDDIEDKDLSKAIKEMVADEFKFILEKLEFNQYAYEIFRKWYVDGRIYYHVMVDEKNPQLGVQGLRYIDAAKIRKVRERRVRKVAGNNDVTVAGEPNEYYIYNEKGFNAKTATFSQSPAGTIKIAKDSIVQVTSGLTTSNNSTVISYLHKAIKPLNQLKIMEDSLVIYRISRAPERRAFYIDVGNLPKQKAEQYVKDVMNRFKNRVVYDQSTGQIKDDRKFMTMLEDYWLPRREGGKGTEIQPLAGGANLGEITDIEYFQKLLYTALNIPVSRLDSQTVYNVGRTAEINRDEVKFAKFVTRLRARFSGVFLKVLERQLLLKKIIDSTVWEGIKNQIRFDFTKDNYFEELKEIEMYRERFEILQATDNYRGVYFSNMWLRKNILRQSEEEIEQMDKEIAEEASNVQYNQPLPDSGQDDGGDDQFPQPGQPPQPFNTGPQAPGAASGKPFGGQ